MTPLGSRLYSMARDLLKAFGEHEGEVGSITVVLRKGTRLYVVSDVPDGEEPIPIRVMDEAVREE